MAKTVSPEEFARARDEMLESILTRAEILACPGVMEALIEYYNNDIIDHALEARDECPECEGSGWLVMNEGDDGIPLGEIQACDCGRLPDDDAAADAARKEGYILEKLYDSLDEPLRSGCYIWKVVKE